MHFTAKAILGMAPSVGLASCLGAAPSESGNAHDASLETSASSDGGKAPPESGATGDGAATVQADATTGEAGAMDAGDGAADVDVAIPLVTLTCSDTSWVYAQPIDLGPQASLLWTSNASPTTVRIAASDLSMNPIFTVYSIDTSTTPPAVTSLVIPNADAALMNTGPGIRLSNGFAVPVEVFGTGTDIGLYSFADSTPLPAQPPSLSVIASVNGQMIQQQVVLQVGASQYFTAIPTYEGSTFGISAGVAVGGQLATLIPVDSSTTGGFGLQIAVLAGSNVSLFATKYPGPSLGYYPIPATVSTAGAFQALAPLQTAGTDQEMLDAVPGSATDTTNLAYQESDVIDGGYVSRVVVDQVANSALAPLQLSSLVGSTSFDQSFVDPATFPCNGRARFFGDDFVYLGSGCVGDGHTQWVNFIWYDVHGVVRASQTGLSGILQGQGYALETIAASPGPRTPTSAAWNIIWIEQVENDAGVDVSEMYFNQLVCQ